MIEIDQLLQVHLKQLTLRLFLLSSDAWFSQVMWRIEALFGITIA